MSDKPFNTDQYGYLHETFYTKEEARNRDARIDKMLDNVEETLVTTREINTIVKADKELKTAHKIIIDKLFEIPLFRFIIGCAFFIIILVVATVLGPEEVNNFVIKESSRILVACISFATGYAFFTRPKKPKGGEK